MNTSRYKALMNEIRPHESPRNNVINMQFKIELFVNYDTLVLHFINRYNNITTNT